MQRFFGITRREVLTALGATLGGALATTRLRATQRRLAPLAPSFQVEPPEEGAARPALSLPSRSAGAVGASALLDRGASLSPRELEERLVEEVLSGNVPSFLRVPKPLVGFTPEGASMTLWVIGDYLCVGSDDDYLHLPLTGIGAQRIALGTGAILPTPALVDAIYLSAETRLPPQALGQPPEVEWAAQAREHDALVRRAMRQAAHEPGALVAGHKKDVVVTPALAYAPGKVAIYGFHRAPGDAIQPLSTVHHVRYTDYSHGVRLLVDAYEHAGKRGRLSDLLTAKATWMSPAGAIRWPCYGPA